MCDETTPPRRHVLHYTISADDGTTVEVDLCDEHDVELHRLLRKPRGVIVIEGREYPEPPVGLDPTPPPNRPPRKKRP